MSRPWVLCDHLLLVDVATLVGLLVQREASSPEELVVLEKMVALEKAMLLLIAAAVREKAAVLVKAAVVPGRRVVRAGAAVVV